MGLIGRRQKQTREFTDEKWDYINLADFKAKGLGPGFAYFWLWLMLIVSVAVYALDSFTAVNLLIFDQWASKIRPGIPLSVSKWIFSICIILSFINLAYEAFRAYRVMRRSNVAECYLDPLAVRWESIRIFGGQGYRRFLVFAELTKSNKGGQYAALFTYFSLQGEYHRPLDNGALADTGLSLDPRPHLLRTPPSDQRLYLQVSLRGQAARALLQCRRFP